MASTWGNAWGSRWGFSWGAAVTVVSRRGDDAGRRVPIVYREQPREEPVARTRPRRRIVREVPFVPQTLPPLPVLEPLQPSPDGRMAQVMAAHRAADGDATVMQALAGRMREAQLADEDEIEVLLLAAA